MTASTPLPLGLFAPAGTGAGQISPLLWGLIWLSIVVVALVTLAVVVGILLRASRERDPAQVPVTRDGGGLWWIFGGVGVSTLVLIAFTGWTIATIAGIASPPKAAALTIDVSARQWWWGISYEDAGASTAFATANEIHIPVGKPVAFNLTSPDVIHSFWVPALGGKTDVIPGRVNHMWLQAEKPGTYRGQCSEYCGLQHSWMGFTVIAESAADFQSWRASQQTSADMPTNGEIQIGLDRFTEQCGKCHTVRGTAAHGQKGPDLTHVMSRSSLGAGILDNSRGNLAGWIAHPQGIKPGALMPDIAMSGPEFQAILSYVETLK